MTAELFHTRLRNDSAHTCIGNGMEGKRNGREVGFSSIHLTDRVRGKADGGYAARFGGVR